MKHLRGLGLFLLCLHGAARRSLRITSSHQDAQQQNKTLANGFEVSAEAREALNPLSVGSRRVEHPAPHWAARRAQDALTPPGGARKKLRAVPRLRDPQMKWGVDIAPWNVVYGQQASPVALPPGIKSQGPEPFEVTDEQRRALLEDGVVILRGFLSPEWLEYLRAATDWQVENPHFWSTTGVASGMYDYIQRSIWSSNDAFAEFLYHSPLASALAGLANATELRLTTDLLMVNPNTGFKWHQDNQNGPIDAFGSNGGSSNKELPALRWWITMDDTPKDYGAPVYLKGSHKNKKVNDDAVFVDLERDELLDYEILELRPKAGDLLVWHARAIHKIDGPEDKDWGKVKRRVLGGTVAVDDAKYMTLGRVLFSDMGSHGLQEGEPLRHAMFPRIYPAPDPAEQAYRKEGKCTRTTEGMMRLTTNIMNSAGEMLSFLKVTK